MFCIKCGAQLPPDSQFCTNCGAKIENVMAPNVGPITPQQMGQPYGNVQKKKSKALLWILTGVGAVLIAAAVVYFVVLAPGGTGGPFSGTTVQTRFANDAVGVFTGAFGGLTSDTKTNQLMDKPFDISMKLSAEFSGIKSDMDLSAAYDEKALGMSIKSSSDYSGSDLGEFFADSETLDDTMKMLLIEDILYMDQGGTVSGLEFDTYADLSKPMSLKERMAALFDSGKNNGIDYLKLTELFLNSIDESHIEKNANETTLTLDADALADTLDVFADKLKDDKELNEALNEFIKESAGYAYDISDLISLTAPMLSQSDFEMVWTVSYEGGKPMGNEITFELEGSQVFEAVIAYENKGNDRKIGIDFTADGQTGTIDLLLSKTAKGIEFDGSVRIPGSDDVTFSGWEKVSGNDVLGSVKITSAGTDVASVDYEGTISIGIPKETVEDDSRFDVDTDNATITDFSQSFIGGDGGLAGFPLLGMAS